MLPLHALRVAGQADRLRRRHARALRRPWERAPGPRGWRRARRAGRWRVGGAWSDATSAAQLDPEGVRDRADAALGVEHRRARRGACGRRPPAARPRTRAARRPGSAAPAVRSACPARAAAAPGGTAAAALGQSSAAHTTSGASAPSASSGSAGSVVATHAISGPSPTGPQRWRSASPASRSGPHPKQLGKGWSSARRCVRRAAAAAASRSTAPGRVTRTSPGRAVATSMSPSPQLRGRVRRASPTAACRAAAGRRAAPRRRARRRGRPAGRPRSRRCPMPGGPRKRCSTTKVSAMTGRGYPPIRQAGPRRARDRCRRPAPSRRGRARGGAAGRRSRGCGCR